MYPQEIQLKKKKKKNRENKTKEDYIIFYHITFGNESRRTRMVRGTPDTSFGDKLTSSTSPSTLKKNKSQERKTHI